jgi:hypothetical protein
MDRTLGRSLLSHQVAGLMQQHSGGVLFTGRDDNRAELALLLKKTVYTRGCIFVIS